MGEPASVLCLAEHADGSSPASGSAAAATSSTAPAWRQSRGVDPDSHKCGMVTAPAGQKSKGKEQDSYKYGMVTLSNLKQAEKDLDSMLARNGKKSAEIRSKGPGHSYALGHGPHINLFEEAEQ